jgi:hypothetical protein
VPAVAEDLSGLHTGEGVLDSGTNLLVGAIVFLLPGRELFTLAPTMWNPASAVRGHTTLIAEANPQVNDLRSVDPGSESPKV